MRNYGRDLDGIFWGVLTLSVGFHLILLVLLTQWRFPDDSEDSTVEPVAVEVRTELVESTDQTQVQDFQPVSYQRKASQPENPEVTLPEHSYQRNSRPTPVRQFSFLNQTSAPTRAEIQQNFIPDSPDPTRPDTGAQLDLRGDGPPELQSVQNPESTPFQINTRQSSDDFTLTLAEQPPVPADIRSGLTASGSDTNGASYQVQVDAEGAVQSVETIESAGSADLDEAIMEWIRQWRYEEPGFGTKTVVRVATPGSSEA